MGGVAVDPETGAWVLGRGWEALLELGWGGSLVPVSGLDLAGLVHLPSILLRGGEVPLSWEAAGGGPCSSLCWCGHPLGRHRPGQVLVGGGLLGPGLRRLRTLSGSSPAAWRDLHPYAPRDRWLIGTWFQPVSCCLLRVGPLGTRALGWCPPHCPAWPHPCI